MPGLLSQLQGGKPDPDAPPTQAELAAIKKREQEEAKQRGILNKHRANRKKKLKAKKKVQRRNR